MKFSNKVLASSIAINMAEQKRILNHINNHTEKQAELARKEYKRFNLINLFIQMVQLKKYQEILVYMKIHFGIQIVVKNMYNFNKKMI